MKRWFARIVVCLLLGAILNILVAWGIALCSELRVNPGSDHFRGYAIEVLPGGEKWILIADGGAGVLNVLLYVEGAAPFVGLAESVRDWQRFSGAQFDPPNWLADAQRMPVGKRGLTEAAVFATGWPCVSNYALFEVTSTPPATGGMGGRGFELAGSSGIVVKHSPGKRLPERVLPMRPIWFATAVNTAFYAALLYGLYMSSIYGRRTMRRRRGKCVQCGHIMLPEQIVCPECGRQRYMRINSRQSEAPSL